MSEEQYRRALVRITQMIGPGPCSANTCEGCQVEVYEAVSIALTVLGFSSWEEFREVFNAPPDPED